MKLILGLAALTLLGVVGLIGYVRLAPQDVSRWHVPIPEQVPSGVVQFVPAADPGAVLAKLATIAAAMPRTTAEAGSVDEGRITWMARSRLWGFPDFITAEVTPKGVRLWSRQRYGTGDYGVNAARLAAWMAGL